MQIKRFCARVVLLVALMEGAWACGEDPPTALESFADGQRLRAQYVEFAGGATLFRGFFDTARGEPCGFDGLVGPSGADTCLPASTINRSYVRDFADEACTEPAVSVPGATTAIVMLPANACDAEPEIFEPGDVLATHYQLTSDGSCVESSQGPALRRLGASVPLDRYVSALPVRDPTGGRIDALTLVAADGARQVLAGWDVEREESVEQSLEAEPTVWAPRGVAYDDSGVFSDATCTRAVARKFGSSARCPVTTILGPQLRAAGMRIEPSALFARDDTGSCAPYRGPKDDLFFERGELIAADAFAELAIVELGTGRIRQRVAASPEGTGIVPIGTGQSAFFDTTTNQPCEVVSVSDGTARCLPPVFESLYFADAACTQSLLQAYAPAAALVTIATYPGGDAPPTHAVRHVGTQYLDPALYAQVSSVCTPVVRPDGFDYFLLGEAVALTEFEAALVHE